MFHDTLYSDRPVKYRRVSLTCHHCKQGFNTLVTGSFEKVKCPYETCAREFRADTPADSAVSRPTHEDDAERAGPVLSTWNAVQNLQQERDKVFEKLKIYEAQIAQAQTNDGSQARWLIDEYYKLSARCDHYHRQLMEISRERVEALEKSLSAKANIACPFVRVPGEVLDEIFGNLDAREVSALRPACEKLNSYGARFLGENHLICRFEQSFGGGSYGLEDDQRKSWEEMRCMLLGVFHGLGNDVLPNLNDAQAYEEEQAAVFLCHIATCYPTSNKSILEYFSLNGDPGREYLAPFVNMRFITLADTCSEDPPTVDLSFLSATPKLEGIFFGNHKIVNAGSVRHLKNLRTLMFTGTQDCGMDVAEFEDMFRNLPVTMKEIFWNPNEEGVNEGGCLCRVWNGAKRLTNLESMPADLIPKSGECPRCRRDGPALSSVALTFPRLHTLWGEVKYGRFMRSLDFKWSQLRRLTIHTPLASDMASLAKNCPNLKVLSLKSSYARSFRALELPSGCSFARLSALYLENVEKLEREFFGVAPALAEVHIACGKLTGASLTGNSDVASARATQLADMVSALPPTVRYVTLRLPEGATPEMLEAVEAAIPHDHASADTELERFEVLRIYLSSSKDEDEYLDAIEFPNPKLKNLIISQKITQGRYADDVFDLFCGTMVNGRKLEYVAGSYGISYTKSLHPPPAVTRDFFTAPYSQELSRSAPLVFGRTDLELQLAAEDEAERNMWGSGFW